MILFTDSVKKICISRGFFLGQQNPTGFFPSVAGILLDFSQAWPEFWIFVIPKHRRCWQNPREGNKSPPRTPQSWNSQLIRAGSAHPEAELEALVPQTPQNPLDLGFQDKIKELNPPPWSSTSLVCGQIPKIPNSTELESLDYPWGISGAAPNPPHVQKKKNLGRFFRGESGAVIPKKAG